MAPDSSQRQTERSIRIRQFQEEDAPDAKRLFADGMMAYSDDPSLEHRWVDLVRKVHATDLSDVHNVYIAPGGNFWVATIDGVDGNDRVVGTIAVVPKPDRCCEIFRLVVDSTVRQMGIGRLLVAHLEAWARRRGLATVELKAFDPPVPFYEKLGFRRVRSWAYWEDPDYPVNALVKQL